MASNEIVINGSTGGGIEREVPDSFMKPLMAYLDMVKEKTSGPSNNPVEDLAANLVAEADREIFEANELSEVTLVDAPDGCDLTSTEEVHEGGGPTIVRRTPDDSEQYLSDLPGWTNVPVQNDSFSQKLANQSLRLVAVLMDTLEPVLTPDTTGEPTTRSGSPLVETLQALRSNLASLVRRIDI